MRVVRLLASLRPSGMERMLVSAGPHFASAGIDSVIFGQGEDHPYVDELTAAGYRVRTVPGMKLIDGYRAIHGFFLAERWWAIKRLAQAMASDRYLDTFVALVAARKPASRIADAHERNAFGAKLSGFEAAK